VTGVDLIVHNCGAVYSTDKEVVEFDMTSRFNELMDVINGTSHKVIVFAPYRHVIHRLEDAMTKEGVAYGSMHGGVPAGQRATIVKQFQTEDNPRVILAHPAAVAHGLTLTRADTVVWWGPTPSAELYLQGNARAHRAGQVNKVTIVRIQGSPVEKRMYALLDGKVDIHQCLVDLYKQEVEG
jgi:SNF2 family DNA or RNA helicase